MARTKIKHRSYKNATNPQVETLPEPENLRVEAPAQVVPDIASSEDESLPVVLIRPPSKAERPPDPPPKLEDPHSLPSPTRPDDVSVSCTPATITSIRATNGHTFPVSDQLSPVSPESPVNLSRHSPTPGCSRNSTPVRQPEPQPSTSYYQPSTSYHQPSTSYHQPSTSYHQPSTSYHQPSNSYQDRDTPSPQPGMSYACDMPSTSYHRPRSPTEPVPGCSRDYPGPGTSTTVDYTYNSSPSSPVNLSWNSPIPGCSRDSAHRPRTGTSSEPTRMSPSPPSGMPIWDSMKENCQQRANAAADYRPRTPDMNAVPVDEIFSPTTQKEIRSTIRNLFPNGPPPLPLIKPMRRPKKGEPYIVGCNKRPRVPSPHCLTVFQGDKYGITSETNVDEDEESTPAKRNRRNPGAPGYSKSKFNAQSDDIASRLKLHEKIDALLGRGETQEEPVGYVTKKNIPPRKFSPLPSTSTDSETIMKNDKHFSESFGQNSDMEDDDDDELPEIVWGSTPKYAKLKSHVAAHAVMLDTNNDSRQSDDNVLVINEDDNNNNYSPVEYDYSEIQFDKYIPKEKLIESDVVIVDPKPAGEPKIIETIDLKDGYVFKPPKPVTPTPSGEVICVEDVTVTSENQNDTNGNVIDLLEPTQASNNAGLVQRASNKLRNATETQSDLVIEVPDVECNNNTSQSSNSSTLSYPDVQFVNETRTERSLPNGTGNPTGQNILDVQIISCDGDSNSRPRSNELLNELQSWFSMLTDSCERRLPPRCRSRSKKNSPNRENRAPTVNNNVSNPTPESSTQSAPTAEPEPSNGKNLGDCPICLDSLSASLLASTNCGHVFCLECIKKSLSTTGKKCPTCRKQLKGVGYHQVFL